MSRWTNAETEGGSSEYSCRHGPEGFGCIGLGRCTRLFRLGWSPSDSDGARSDLADRRSAAFPIIHVSRGLRPHDGGRSGGGAILACKQYPVVGPPPRV